MTSVLLGKGDEDKDMHRRRLREVPGRRALCTSRRGNHAQEKLTWSTQRLWTSSLWSQEDKSLTTCSVCSLWYNSSSRLTHCHTLYITTWQNAVHWRREWQTTSVFFLENSMNSMKRQNDRILKEALPRLVCAQYATGDQWRNNSRKNEGMELKQEQYPVVDVTGDRSKIRCCKEQYWNLECCVHESRQIGSSQTGDGKSEHRHSRNQQTKMDWNGWI